MEQYRETLDEKDISTIEDAMLCKAHAIKRDINVSSQDKDKALIHLILVMLKIKEKS